MASPQVQLIDELKKLITRAKRHRQDSRAFEWLPVETQHVIVRLVRDIRMSTDEAVGSLRSELQKEVKHCDGLPARIDDLTKAVKEKCATVEQRARDIRRLRATETHQEREMMKLRAQVNEEREAQSCERPAQKAKHQQRPMIELQEALLGAVRRFAAAVGTNQKIHEMQEQFVPVRDDITKLLDFVKQLPASVPRGAAPVKTPSSTS